MSAEEEVARLRSRIAKAIVCLRASGLINRVECAIVILRGLDEQRRMPVSSALTEELTMQSVLWALQRMVELRKAGEKARFRVTWMTRDGVREYRLEVRREAGEIERAIFPFPLVGSESVEEEPG